jgi:hypothetical protein
VDPLGKIFLTFFTFFPEGSPFFTLVQAFCHLPPPPVEGEPAANPSLLLANLCCLAANLCCLAAALLSLE